MLVLVRTSNYIYISSRALFFSQEIIKIVNNCRVRFIWQTIDTYSVNTFSELLSSLPFPSNGEDKWTLVRCDSSHPKADVCTTNNELLLWIFYFSSLTEEAKGDWQGKEISAPHRQTKLVNYAVSHTGSQFTHNHHLRTTIPLRKLINLAKGYVWG